MTTSATDIKEVIVTLETYAEVGTSESFCKCIEALLALDPYYWAAYPQLRSEFLLHILNIHERRNLFQYSCIKDFAKLMVEQVYYVHEDFEEHESDLQLYDFLSEACS